MKRTLKKDIVCDISHFLEVLKVNVEIFQFLLLSTMDQICSQSLCFSFFVPNHDTFVIDKKQSKSLPCKSTSDDGLNLVRLTDLLYLFLPITMIAPVN